jgi:Peptidase family S41
MMISPRWTPTLLCAAVACFVLGKHSLAQHQQAAPRNADIAKSELRNPIGVFPFRRESWIEDYAYLKSELELSYANLAWFASPQSGVNLPELDRRTRRMLESSENPDDANAAILAFIGGFHDGHFAPVPSEQEPTEKLSTPPEPSFGELSPMNGCAALGYAPVRSIAFSLPFDSLPGSSIDSDGVSRLFRSGIASSAAGTRLGIVRIPRFRPQDAPPASCLERWIAWQKTAQPIDVGSLTQQIAQDWFEILAAQLRQFRTEGVTALIVDVGGNTGGNDSGDWAARLFTPNEVHSARLLLAASPSANAYFDEQLQSLRGALDEHPNASTQTQNTLRAAISDFERRKRDLSSRRCDMSWVWHEQRPWNPTGCSRLIDAGFASGEVDYLPRGALEASGLASKVYWAASVDQFRGAWSGPVYILTDAKTASSAEMFSAVMRDNSIAKTVGTSTEGDGCGFMDDEGRVELPHSHLRFAVPNCVRLRKDGTDEVAGIKPDIPVLPTRGEDTRARAARMLELIEADLRRN